MFAERTDGDWRSRRAIRVTCSRGCGRDPLAWNLPSILSFVVSGWEGSLATTASIAVSVVLHGAMPHHRSGCAPSLPRAHCALTRAPLDPTRAWSRSDRRRWRLRLALGRSAPPHNILDDAHAAALLAHNLLDLADLGGQLLDLGLVEAGSVRGGLFDVEAGADVDEDALGVGEAAGDVERGGQRDEDGGLCGGGGEGGEAGGAGLEARARGHEGGGAGLEVLEFGVELGVDLLEGGGGEGGEVDCAGGG